MANRKLSRAELIKANELLKTHLKVVSDGMVEYNGDWDDESIAKQIAPDVRSSSIGGIRIELFGRFIRKLPDNSEHYRKIDEKLTTLERSLNDTVAKLHELVLKHRKLCENLSLNRVIDVKHLA